MGIDVLKAMTSIGIVKMAVAASAIDARLKLCGR
jgi:hypothetical protein